MEKNSVLMGIVLGIIMPVIGFVIVEFIFQQLTHMGIMDNVSVSTSEKRMRTVALIALCFNLLPLHFFKNKRWIDSMRGIVFPTLVYVGFWVYRFSDALMGF